MPGVTNRTALVTGAGSPAGIGFAVARLLRDAGARVAISSTTGRIFERLDELGEPSAGACAQIADLTQPDAVQALVDEVTTRLGPIDIVINNAGMTQVGRDEPSASLATTSDEAWRYGIDINLSSAFYVTRAVLPGMQQRGYGRIVQMSSVTGPVAGIEGSAVYAAAKAGMLGMVRSLAIEVGKFNITANCIGPGWIETASSSAEEIVAGRHTPVGRPGTPAEVAQAALFLASEESSYITGQLIVVDGGNTIQEYKVGPAGDAGA